MAEPTSPLAAFLQGKPTPNAGDGMLGYGRRNTLFPGEDSYFQSNPHVAGMAAETNDVVLNPYSPPNVNRDAVARNESFRLLMRDHDMNPSFGVTPEQQSAFAATPYGSNPQALRETLAARIYSGDPSAQATPDQRNWVRSQLFPGPPR